MLSTRSHCIPATDGELYGYNDVIDKELIKRTKVSFRSPEYKSNENAKETRRRILGESVTIFLRELRGKWPENKELIVGIPRGDYWGPPYGNIFIDWRTWLKEKLVDGLYLGEISGKTLYRNVITPDQYRNFLSDEEAGIGVNPYYYDLEHIYGPECVDAGVKLYVNGDSKSVKRESCGGQYFPRLEIGKDQ
jgi:hypothetical protein